MRKSEGLLFNPGIKLQAWNLLPTELIKTYIIKLFVTNLYLKTNNIF